MAISIDYSTLIIFVPKADTILIQLSPFEIRELPLNWFRNELKTLEANAVGMCFLDTHKHNTEVNIGGLTLARVIEIINGYTITFEDGQYAVNLTGANSNVGDVINVNQVSVRSFNSAGMTSSPAIEYSSFNGGVTVDVINGISGTIYNIGTPSNPVDNMADALLIASYRGFTTFFINGDITLGDSLDYEQYSFVGESVDKTTITILSNALTEKCEFYECTLTGILDGQCKVKNSIIGNINYISGVVELCILQGTITLGGGASAYFLDCWAGSNLGMPPEIDLGGSGQNLVMQNFNGYIKWKNKTGTDQANAALNAGWIELDSTITAGTLNIIGVGTVEDNTTGTAVVNTDHLLDNNLIAGNVWDKDISGTPVVNSASSAVRASTYIKGIVSLDTVNGSAGTGWPIGTGYNPSNNLTDALTIMSYGNIKELLAESDITITASHDVSGIGIRSNGKMGTDIILEAGCTVDKTTFSNINIQGEITSGNQMLIEDCSIGELENFRGIMNVVSFSQGSEISFDGWATIINGTAGGEPSNEVEFSIGTADVNIVHWDGNLKIKDKTGSNRTVINCNSGNIIIDSTCIAGKIQLIGLGTIEADNSGAGCTVDKSAFIDGTHIDDLYKLQGLDPNAPMTVTPTTRVAVGIDQSITGDGINTSTVTRN